MIDAGHTPESAYRNRRAILKTIGLGVLGGFCIPQASCSREEELQPGSGSSIPDIETAPGEFSPKFDMSELYPAKRNEKYTLDRPITDEQVASRFNNFYEFTTAKDRIWKMVEKFVDAPWEVEVTGLVEKPLKMDFTELIQKMPLEERLYRLRCVETWAMAVPWTGFPLAELLKMVQPTSKATHIRMISFLKPDEAPGQKKDLSYPWPYTEGLTMAEAMNELTLIATGIYGHQMPKQHGTPLRLIVPWKYGFKSVKSITRFEVIDHRPRTFWNDLIPNEYSFTANVNPKKSHPRWSQAQEWLIPTKERIPTLPYNGYGEYVAYLYG